MFLHFPFFFYTSYKTFAEGIGQSRDMTIGKNILRFKV